MNKNGTHYAELYTKLRETPATQLSDEVLDEIFNRPEVKAKQGKLSREQIKIASRMVHRVAQSVGMAEFTGYMASGEIPSMKLNAKEMELLHGGSINLNNYLFIATIVLSALHL